MLDKVDRRSERSRQALRASFIALLFERGFRKLTVNDVVSRANVGRSTFYEHFKSKDDLLKQVLAERFACLANVMGSNEPASTLVPDLQHFKANYKLARMLFSSPTHRVLVRTLTEQIEARLLVLRARMGVTELIIPLELMALQLAEAQLAVLEHWLLGKVASRPEAVAEALFAGTNGAAMALLSCKNF